MKNFTSWIHYLFCTSLLFCVTPISFSQVGANDPTFNIEDISPVTGLNSFVTCTVIQNDGKIIIGGGFTTYHSASVTYLIRLNADGSRDNTFNTGTGANNIINAIAIQADGKIVIAGEFTTVNGASRNRIARLNADGSLDNTFNPGTGANSSIYAIAIQADGKIVIGGQFTTVNGNTRNRIARLNTDGSIDNIFAPNVSNIIDAIAIQADGKIVIVGLFTTVNGNTRNRIARLNTNGAVDNTFNPVFGANGEIWGLVIQSDGKIVVGGSFTNYDGNTRNRMARLNTNGSLDNTFNPGTGANNTVYSLAAQPDGRILIGGSFTGYNGIARNRIARLNTNGTLDNTFNTGSGAGNYVNAIAIQSDGRILIGGAFTSFNSVHRNYIARILNCSGQALATSGKVQSLYITGATSFIDNCLDLITTVTPNGATPVSGSTTARVWIENIQPQQYVKRHFEITPSVNASTSTSNITLYFTQSEFDAFNAVNTLKLPEGPADAAGIANLRIEKRSGSSSDGSGLPDTYNGSSITIDPADANIIWNAAASRWEVRFDVIGHSGFFAKTSSFLLPVTWIDFHAAVSNSLHAELEWRTDAYNVSGYVVEKSEDGRNFNRVATLNDMGNGVHSYVWTDPVALKETNYYYRIRQTDVDGSFSFSKVVAISLNTGSHRLQVYPNPLKDGVRIISREPQTVVIADITGKAIQNIMLVKGSNYINIAGLQNGVYILRTQNGESVKLIKE